MNIEHVRLLMKLTASCCMHAGTVSGSCARGGRTGRRTSRSARSRRGRATCTTTPSPGSAARCGGTRTSPGCAPPSTGPSSSCPGPASPTRSRRRTRRSPSSSVSSPGARERRRSDRSRRCLAGLLACVLILCAVVGEWWLADTEVVVEQALQLGAGPNVSDAHTINGLPGPLYNCSAKGAFFLLTSFFCLD
jgi:hypothetical protein